MHHRRLVFVELEPLRHQPLVRAAAGVLHGLGVGVLSLDQHANFDATLDGLGERPVAGFVDDEIRGADIERLHRGADGKQIEALQIIAAAGWGAAKDEGAVARRRRQPFIWRIERWLDRSERIASTTRSTCTPRRAAASSAAVNWSATVPCS